MAGGFTLGECPCVSIMGRLCSGLSRSVALVAGKESARVGPAGAVNARGLSFAVQAANGLTAGLPGQFKSIFRAGMIGFIDS